MGMQILTCAGSGPVLTRPMSRLDSLPVATQIDEVSYAPTLEPGTWAIDPEPRWRTSKGAPASTMGCLVVNPADALDLRPHPAVGRNSGCCGHDGCDGPNRLCPGCGAEVATLSDDCWTYVEVRFEPGAVRVISQR